MTHINITRVEREILLRIPIQFRKSVGHKVTIYRPANLKIEMDGFLDRCDLTKLKLNKINIFKRYMASRED